jgi:hypothetical protein
MANKIFGRFVRTVLAVAMLAGAQFASAADVAAGSVVRLGNGTGNYAGVFNGSVVSGPGAGGTFQSFCLERKEYFSSYTQNLYVKSVGTSTLNDQYSAPSVTNQNNTISSDPLSEATAWLFTQFYNNKPTFAGTAGLADSFQTAIWYLENELTATQFLGTNKTSQIQVKDQWIPRQRISGHWVDAHWTYKTETITTHTAGEFENAQAKLWVDAAIEATTAGIDGIDNWNGLGNVRALNLFTNYDTRTKTYSGYSQDQLYMVSAVPETETYAMMLAGLGLMGTIARRRKNKNA